MTPETRLALCAAGLCIFGVALLIAAFISAGRDHRRQT